MSLAAWLPSLYGAIFWVPPVLFLQGLQGQTENNSSIPWFSGGGEGWEDLEAAAEPPAGHLA